VVEADGVGVAEGFLASTRGGTWGDGSIGGFGGLVCGLGLGRVCDCW
jgi:hypothetical protein